MENKTGKLKSNQKDMLRRRNLDPENYILIKETITSLYLRDKRTGAIKILTKHN